MTTISSAEIVSSRPDGTPPGCCDFGIAIMCALPLEATTVSELFEERWDVMKLEIQPNDANAYSIGSIGPHSVVLVHLPRVGKVSYATIAAHLGRSFPSLRLAVLVGICGGIPAGSDDQVLLGDVVISDKIVEYDLGKQLVVKNPTRKKLMQENIFRGLQDLQQSLGDSAAYPGRKWDKLFRPDYVHRHRKSLDCSECTDNKVCDLSVKIACEELGCSEEGLETKMRLRESHNPVIHFGFLASGDTVMRSGKLRDDIAKQTNDIAWIVIKGACDYADCHKNKKFQGYATETAAAATKDFLYTKNTSESPPSTQFPSD
ncbi:nucleoside phosphorylase domain-containing protein [Podospora fimiseda]|uniref:Nucleoside phosphorylase domain-containing protein n=1 Tax=Podospora fimiseda TaxID=252190 RepID=A0AAN7GU59_9PEZI|nr:nucleoside phosphorylase domain-containing protein [Podospora fimiseda]